MDNINESCDLIATQNTNDKSNAEMDENNVNAENTEGVANSRHIDTNDKENDNNDQGNRTDDETTSDSGVSRKSEIVDYTQSPEYKSLIQEIRQNLQCATRLQLKNSSALVRRVAVLLLEFLGSTTLDIDELLTSYVCLSKLLLIFLNYNFVVEIFR